MVEIRERQIKLGAQTVLGNDGITAGEGSLIRPLEFNHYATDGYGNPANATGTTISFIKRFLSLADSAPFDIVIIGFDELFQKVGLVNANDGFSAYAEISAAVTIPTGSSDGNIIKILFVLKKFTGEPNGFGLRIDYLSPNEVGFITPKTSLEDGLVLTCTPLEYLGEIPDYMWIVKIDIITTLLDQQ